MQVEKILEACGLWDADHMPLLGGDINQSYRIHDREKKYFLNINDALRYPGMFRKEMNGLNSLRQENQLLIPSVIKCGVIKEQQYLLLEWMETGKADHSGWKNFGKALAGLHQRSQPQFGFYEDNYIGTLPQHNEAAESWKEFYSTRRLQPLIKLLFDKKEFDKQTVRAATNFCNNLDVIFPEEPPALLHGDLWSGNFMFTENGKAALYDPAVYYGHREIDLGMTKLFGGFDPLFYSGYQEIYPLEPGWEKRLDYSQLYPLLVHAVMFDGHYIGKCRNILDPFL